MELMLNRLGSVSRKMPKVKPIEVDNMEFVDSDGVLKSVNHFEYLSKYKVSDFDINNLKNAGVPLEEMPVSLSMENPDAVINDLEKQLNFDNHE